MGRQKSLTTSETSGRGSFQQNNRTPSRTICPNFDVVELKRVSQHFFIHTLHQLCCLLPGKKAFLFPVEFSPTGAFDLRQERALVTVVEVDQRGVQVEVVVEVDQLSDGLLVGLGRDMIREGVVVVDVGQLEQGRVVQAASRVVARLQPQGKLLVHHVRARVGCEVRSERLVGAEQVGQDVGVEGDLSREHFFEIVQVLLHERRLEVKVLLGDLPLEQRTPRLGHHGRREGDLSRAASVAAAVQVVVVVGAARHLGGRLAPAVDDAAAAHAGSNGDPGADEERVDGLHDGGREGAHRSFHCRLRWQAAVIVGAGHEQVVAVVVVGHVLKECVANLLAGTHFKYTSSSIMKI